MKVATFNRKHGVILRRPDGRRYRADATMAAVRNAEEELRRPKRNGRRKASA
jgi:hypothetical protein